MLDNFYNHKNKYNASKFELQLKQKKLKMTTKVKIEKRPEHDLVA